MKLVNLETLKEKKLISKSIKKAKIFGNSEIDTKVTVEGIALTNGARVSIENAGGKIINDDGNKKVTENKDNSEESDK